MNLTLQDDREALIEMLQKRNASLETELDEMTIALSQAWDQLVPFLQAGPAQSAEDTEQDFIPVIQATMAGADAEFGAIYLFDGMWLSLPDPDTLHLSEARKQLLQENLREDSALQWDEINCNDKQVHWIFAPILLDHRIIGAIGIGHSQNDRLFTALENRILARMADRVAHQIAASELALSRQREAAAAREMQIASMIQRSIQPKYNPRHPAMRLASSWQPAKRVGGDAWGWMEQADGRVSWFILDVAGKGLPAALAAMSLHTALSMGLRIGLPLDEVIKLVNEHFYDAFSDTDFMATITLISVDPRSGILRQVNAGHPPTLILNDGVWISLPATAPPIGVLPVMNIEVQKIALGAHDLVVTYSDGYSEIETTDGLWGSEGIIAAISSAELQPDAALQRVNAAADAAEAATEQHDDRTLIIANLI
jgi:serine phosphatase RsbU (regulator of sigma subunit)